VGNYDRAREIYDELWNSGERSSWVSEHLGYIYENGLGNTAVSKEKAFELYSSGADRGYQFSMLGLYRLYKEDGNDQMADYWLDLLARQNNQEAIAILQREARPIPTPDLAN
jgi:TPR repeat protein